MSYPGGNNDQGPKKHKYDEQFKKFEENAGFIHRATKPVGRPKMNT